MLTCEDRAEIWRDLSEEERKAIIRNHRRLFIRHARHRRLERQHVPATTAPAEHRREAPFPTGELVPLPEIRDGRVTWPQRIYAVLAQADDWMTRRELAAALGTRGNKWHYGLRWLEERGVVVRGPERQYKDTTRMVATFALRRVTSDELRVVNDQSTVGRRTPP